MSTESNPQADPIDLGDEQAVDSNPATPTAEAEVDQVSEPEKPLTPQEMDRYECLACGYTYEPAKGDDRSNIKAGVAFQDVPLNWRCPVCGAQKKRFANVGPAGTPSGFKENLSYGLGVNTLTPGQKSILIFGALAVGFFFFISLYGLR
ncbi:MAG: rubredoxin [Leptolyngbya sp. SIOISBB]|nr:rubredoxin [Leptolyngbya sp. SIOISBB]